MKEYIEIPEKYWRFSTKEAIDKLSIQFNLPNTPEMQDWEWEVADSKRITEFYYAYLSENLTDDEKLTLMETILQSIEESEYNLETFEIWKLILQTIENSWPLHLYSVWYWSNWENEDESDVWRITPYLRKIFLKHKEEFSDNG